MGLILAALGTVTGNLADQWKEYFYCDAIDKDVLVVRGRKKTNGRSGNFGQDNVITNGSGIAVADGQCMIIVEDGKVVEICAEPGNYTYDNTIAPSVFTGGLKEGIKDSFKNIVERFSFGGAVGHDQRVYYFNTKEIIENKFGTPNPIPFRVVDKNLNYDTDMSVRCSGIYSYKIIDPVLFYNNVAGNVASMYSRSEIDAQLKAEFISGLNGAFGKLSETGARPSELPGRVDELCQHMNDVLNQKWIAGRGIEVASIAINSVTIPEEDQERLKVLQQAAVLSNAGLAAGYTAGAQGEAMKTAAGNAGGAAVGFMGMNMAQQTGGMNAGNLFQVAAQQQAAQAPAQQAGQWTCSCGTVNTGNFCMNCGNKKPEEQAGGFCSNCGNQLQPGAKFCPNCGTPTGL